MNQACMSVGPLLHALIWNPFDTWHYKLSCGGGGISRGIHIDQYWRTRRPDQTDENLFKDTW